MATMGTTMQTIDRTPGTLVSLQPRAPAAPPLGWPSSGWPVMEVRYRANKFVVRADLHGLRKDEILVEVWDHALSISGERHAASTRPGRHHDPAEPEDVRFSRAIPLPEGARPDTTAATFEAGVLQIEMDAPHWGRSQGRRIDVR